MDKQKIYAHRGGAGYYAENTLAAFSFAIDQGFDGAELDVHLSKDGEVVVHHNASLNHKFCRKADGSYLKKEEEIPLRNLSLQQIREFAVGEPNPWVHNRKLWPNLLPIPGQKIPTLEEVIKLVKEKSDNFSLVIELKIDIFCTSEDEWISLVDRVIEIIEKLNFESRVAVCGFNWNALLYVKDKKSNIPLWFTTHPFSWYMDGDVPKADIPPSKDYLSRFRYAWKHKSAHWLAGFQPDTVEGFAEQVKRAGGDVLFSYYKDTSEDHINRANEKGVEMGGWSVNLREVISLKGISKFCCDYIKLNKPIVSFEENFEFFEDFNTNYKNKNYQKAVEVFEGFDAGGKYYLAEFYAKISAAYRMSKNHSKAEEILNHASKIYPNNVKLLIELAALRNVQKKWQEAICVWGGAFTLSDEWSNLNYKRYKLCFDSIKGGGELSERDITTFFKMLFLKRRWHEIISTYEKIDNFKLALEVKKIWEYACFFVGVNKEFSCLDNYRKPNNIALISGNNRLWIDVCERLFEEKASVSISLNHSPSMCAKLKEQWPDSEIYNGFDMASGSTLLTNSLPYAPSNKITQSIEFLDFKLKAMSIMDRQDNEGRLRLVEREVLFYSMFFFFYSKLIEKNITLVIAAHSPHVGPTFILYETARLLGIKTVHCIQNSIIPAFQITSDYYGARYPSIVGKNPIPKHFLNKMMKYCDDVVATQNYVPDYMKKMHDFDKNNNVIKRDFKNEKKVRERLLRNIDGSNPPDTKGGWRIKSVDFLYNNKINSEGRNTEEIVNSLRNGLIYEYTLLTDKIEDYKDRFVYYPLHYEPEKNSNPDGGFYHDTYKSMVALRDFLPDDVCIYVKEHYSQFSGMREGYTGRSPYFYRAIKQIKNLKIIDFNVPSNELIKNSLFVCNKVGNASLEAACLGKKSVIFGYPWFYGCPNVYSFDEIKSYDDFIKSPVFALQDVKEFFVKWANTYGIYGPMSGGQEVREKERNPDLIKSFMNIGLTADSFVLTLNSNGFLK